MYEYRPNLYKTLMNDNQKIIIDRKFLSNLSQDN